MIDLLTTTDGKVLMSTKYPKEAIQPHIPIFATDADLFTPCSCLPGRLVQGAFTDLLKQIYKRLFGGPLEITYYGKPFKTTYDFIGKSTPKKFKLTDFNREEYSKGLAREGRYHEHLHDR